MKYFNKIIVFNLFLTLCLAPSQAMDLTLSDRIEHGWLEKDFGNKKMKLTIASSFCIDDNPSSGNPAAIVEEFDGDDHQRQQFATKLNLPVTVFIDYLDRTPIFRFFYPAREMPLCIHGSLAAGFILMQHSDQESIQAATKDQHQLLIRRKHNDIIYIAVERGTVLSDTVLLNEVDKMLNIQTGEQIDKNLPLCAATIGSPKLIIPLKSYATLSSCEPNFAFIEQWSIDHNINGLYIYTRDSQNKLCNFIARGFNPKGGSNEDAATGVAVGALYEALNINTEIKVSQGEFISRPSCILAYGENDKIFIGGKIRVDE